jgi:hypothetical protein
MSIKMLGAAIAAATITTAAAGVAQAADAIPYPCCGYVNTTYSFTAAADGDLIAYFAGSTAAYDNQLGVLDNGVQIGGFGLDNHASAIGASYDFGPVMAGDSLVFILHNLTLGADAYSNPSMNVGYDNGPASGTADGHNHVYSTSYTATGPILDSIPMGTFVAFEDLRYPEADYNYNDETFVFTNVSTGGVPEPATWVMMLIGVGALGGALRSNRRLVRATA